MCVCFWGGGGTLYKVIAFGLEHLTLLVLLYDPCKFSNTLLLHYVHGHACTYVQYITTISCTCTKYESITYVPKCLDFLWAPGTSYIAESSPSLALSSESTPSSCSGKSSASPTEGRRELWKGKKRVREGKLGRKDQDGMDGSKGG